jgi:hypothetical protein
MNRRDFLKGTAAAGAAAVLPISILPQEKEPPKEIWGQRDLTDPNLWERRRKYREEAMERYAGTFDFSGMEPEYAQELALLIDNQRLAHVWHEVPKPIPVEDQLQIVYDIYSRCVGTQLVCMQTMAGPAEFIVYEDLEKIGDSHHDFNGKKMDIPVLEFVRKEREVCARTIRMRQNVTPLDPTDISKTITREILTDLRNNAGTIGTLDWSVFSDFGKPWETLYVKMIEIACILHRKTLRPMDSSTGIWVVTSPEIAHVLKRGFDYRNEWKIPSFDIAKVGTICSKWSLYVDPLFPRTHMLFGLRGRPTVEKKDWYYNSGYHYCPYVPFTQYTVLEPNDYLPIPRSLTRRAKLMLFEKEDGEVVKKSGPKYYARLNLVGF